MLLPPTPGDTARYTFKFNANQDYDGGVHDLVVEFNEDFSVPGSIDTSAVVIQYYIDWRKPATNSNGEGKYS